MFGFGDLFGGGRRRGGPQRGADLRYDLEISFEESAARHRDHDSDSAAGELRDLQRVRRRGRLLARRPARSAAARARCACSRASSRRAHLPAVPRRRHASIAKPCQTCHGAGRVAQRAQDHGQDSAGHCHRPAASAAGRRRSRRRRRSCRPPVRRRPRAGARVLPPRRQSTCSARSR